MVAVAKIINESTGWTKITPFADNPKRRGLISEDDSPLVFEGSVESAKDGSRVLEGLFQQANTKNKNRRIYSQTLLERETNKLSRLITENTGILGELDHPETVGINMKFASHRIDKLSMGPGGKSFGRMTIMPSLPIGPAAIGCCDALGGKVGVSSRGSGSLFEKGDIIMVGEDYNMRTYDIVHDQSTFGARPTVVTEELIREFEEFSRARPGSQKIGLKLSRLVDRYLGI